jgi:Domain of unknown function (DUF4169)
MADIINLNERRKQLARQKKADDAAAARARSGRTKGEKSLERKTLENLRDRLEGARRDPERGGLSGGGPGRKGGRHRRDREGEPEREGDDE